MKKIIRQAIKTPDPALADLLGRIGRGDKSIPVHGVEGAAKSFLMALLHRQTPRPLLIITPTEKEA
jgi:excinuclease UvrABC helicase subunit UvrB